MNFLLVTSIFCVLLQNTFGDVVCDDSFECADSTQDDDTIECNGYYGCEESSLTTSEELYCNGDSGCFLSSIVADDGAAVECDGYLGCWRAHIINEEGSVFCDGALACYIADIIGYDLSIGGWYSGYQSSFTADSSTQTEFYYYNYGYLSGAYSDVVVTSDNTLYLYYYGYYAGYRNYIDCESGSTCTLNCLGNGCSDTELFCYSGATCSYDCDDADSCPTVYEISSTLTGTAKATETENKKHKRRLLSSDEELKAIRQSRDTYRSSQKIIDENKWSKADPKFEKAIKKKHQKKSIHSSNNKKSFVTANLGSNNNNLIKDLTSRHILYGVGISTAIYTTLSLMWYFIYYKPRKNDLYSQI